MKWLGQLPDWHTPPVWYCLFWVVWLGLLFLGYCGFWLWMAKTGRGGGSWG